MPTTWGAAITTGWIAMGPGTGIAGMLRRRLWVVAFGLLVLSAAGWAVITVTAGVSVSVVAVTRGTAVEAVYATGVVEPVYWSKVAPTIVGRIAQVLARDGNKVRKGQVLLRLDDRKPQAELARLMAKLKFTAEELERYTELSRRRIASRQAYERARSDHIQALSAVAGARQQLTDYVLTAPLDGTVLRQDGEVGETVAAGHILFWVGKQTPLRIVAEVDEEDIPTVRIGQRALLTADAFGTRVFEGAVKEITPKGDPVNKTYRVRIAVPDNTPLRIGMTTEVNIVVHKVERALLIPFTALRKGVVFVVENGRARRRPVIPGIVGERSAQIKDGLALGEIVVVAPPPGLKDGDRVRVKAPGKKR